MVTTYSDISVLILEIVNNVIVDSVYWNCIADLLHMACYTNSCCLV